MTGVNSNLKHLDLAACRLSMLHIFSMLIGRERVHLDTEGHAFLPPMLPGRELGADAVHLRRQTGSETGEDATVLGDGGLAGTQRYLDEDRGVLRGIPEELNGVEVQRV